MQIAIRMWTLILTVVVMTAGMAQGGWAQDGEAPEFDAQRVQQLIGESKFKEASELLKAVVAADPENENAVFMYGYTLHMAGDVKNALPIHKQAAKFEQFRPIATYNIGCAYALLGESDKALKSLEQAVEYGFSQLSQFDEDPDLDSLRSTSGFALLMARVDGDEELEKQIEAGNQAVQEGEFGQAVSTYQDIVSKHKDHGYAHYRLGYALHANGQLDDAIVQHKKAAKFKSFAPVATYNLACALALKGEAEMAIETLHKAADVGFSQVDYMLSDSDLASIRDDERFTALVKKMRESDWEKVKREKSKATKKSDKGDGQD